MSSEGTLDRADEGRRGCVFCRIVRREERAYIVFEDDATVAFLDNRPLFPGHTLLVTREHHQTLPDLPGKLIGPLFSVAQMLAEAVSRATESEGTFVAINNIVSQSVPHLHVHVVPRRRSDGMKGFFWPRHPYVDEGSILEVQRKIQSAIAQLR